MYVLKIRAQYVQMMIDTDNNSLHPLLSDFTYLTELPSLLYPSLPLSWIANNSKFCNGPLNFEITRFNCTLICCIILFHSTGKTHKLDSLKAILSTGSPLKPQSYDYVYKDIKKDLLLASISGNLLYKVWNNKKKKRTVQF